MEAHKRITSQIRYWAETQTKKEAPQKIQLSEQIRHQTKTQTEKGAHTQGTNALALANLYLLKNLVILSKDMATSLRVLVSLPYCLFSIANLL